MVTKPDGLGWGRGTRALVWWSGNVEVEILEGYPDGRRPEIVDLSRWVDQYPKIIMK